MSVNINRVLDRLAFNANTFYVEPGNSASFILTAYYSDGKSAIITTEATYASSDPSIASIGAGTISGTKNGEATITAYYDGENGYANIVIGTGAGIGAAAISDNQAPIWSPEAVVRTSNITANGMTLSWDAAYDNTGVQFYIIYQNDSELTSLSGSSRSYTVSGLSGGQSYTFRIEAADSAGNRSAGPSVTSQPSGSPAIHPVTEAAQTPIRTAYSEEDEGGAEARSSIRIAAATEWRSTDSGETLVAMVSQDDLEQALSNESKSRVTVQVDDDEAQRAVLELPVHSLLAAAADKRVVFKLSGSTLELPVSAASQIAADSGDGLLRLIISKGSKEQASAAAKLAGKEKVKILLPAPVEFAIEVNGHIVSDYNGAYMERKIALTGANAAVQEAAAMWLDTSTGMWGAVPTVVSGSDSRKEVTIKAPYSGIFTIIQVNRAFKDTASHAAKQEIAYLASRAILSGEAEGVFSPNKAVSRAEFSALLVRSLGLEKLAEASTDTGFKDVVTDDWFAATASVAVKYGLIEGFEDGTFKPEEQITKEQMAVMLYRAAQLAGAKPESADSSRVLNGLADKDQVKSWSKAAFEYLFSQGVVTKTKDNKLIPQAIATRADAAVMLRRLLQTLNM
jgi:chitodextrinase